MEKRLKKQRNRLFLRVTLILFAVWLAVSAAYCVIRLHSEKTDLQNRALGDLSNAKRIISVSEGGAPMPSYIYINNYNLLNFKNLIEGYADVQLIIIDPETGEVLADTSHKTDVLFSMKTDKGNYPDSSGYLDFSTIRGKLSDAQYRRIVGLLNDSSADGRTYELVCTEFFTQQGEFIPLELSVVLTESADSYFSHCEITETFDLGGSVPEGVPVYRNSEYRINIIPKTFFMSEGDGDDIIGQLDEELRRKNVATVSSGGAEYIFYSSEYYFLDAHVYNDATGGFVNSQKLYLLQYAIRANLIDNCLSTLACGVAAIFGFFLFIGVIIFLMIWNTVRTQIIQEQKRLDFTNALAHDIKTPLFVISGYAYSLKEDIDSDDRDSYLDKIILQIEQINGLVHKMLNLSKLDSFAMSLTRTEFDLSELVSGILEDYRNLPEGRTISFSHSGRSSISADRELLGTALQNLIENAVKYSPAGSEIPIDVTDRTITISNPSEPVSKAELKKIWQPYYRVDKSRHKKGNGLGLSIVKSILDLHSAKYEMSIKDGSMVFHAEFN